MVRLRFCIETAFCRSHLIMEASTSTALESLASAAPFPQGVQATAQVDKPGDTSTHFMFKHRIFTIAECRFALNGNDKMPCFYIPMGEQVAAIELAKLQMEFNIPADSVDAALLKKVEKGLNYVKEIRPNDSIPREILDGSASWSVEEHHREIALARMQMELIFWITGFREDMPQLQVMKQIQSESEGRGQIKDAHVKLAQQLSLRDANMSRARVEEIVRETTYIEALRERSYKVGEIAQKIAAFSTAFKKETGFIAEILRMQDLMRRAGKVVGERFARVDNAFKELSKAIGAHRQTIETIRGVRDEVHIELKKWDDYFVLWANLKIERNEETERMFRKFYHFLAENYMEQQSWGGGGKKK